MSQLRLRSSLKEELVAKTDSYSMYLTGPPDIGPNTAEIEQYLNPLRMPMEGQRTAPETVAIEMGIRYLSPEFAGVGVGIVVSIIGLIFAINFGLGTAGLVLMLGPFIAGLIGLLSLVVFAKKRTKERKQSQQIITLP